VVAVAKPDDVEAMLLLVAEVVMGLDRSVTVIAGHLTWAGLESTSLQGGGDGCGGSLVRRERNDAEDQGEGVVGVCVSHCPIVAGGAPSVSVVPQLQVIGLRDVLYGPPQVIARIPTQYAQLLVPQLGEQL
jgi:hypothetical protein